MATIVPGVTFETNGLPTRSELERMSRSLTVKDLTLADLAGSALGILTSATSGATGSLQSNSEVGTMWADAQGNLWLQEQSGPVLMKSHGGGWESRRYFVQPEGANPDTRPGLPLSGDQGNGPREDFTRSSSGAPDSLSVRLATQDFLDYRIGQNGRVLGYLQETGASEYARWNGRGLCFMIDHEQQQDTTDMRATVEEMQNDVTLAGARDAGDSVGRVFHKRFMGASTFQNQSWQAWIAAPGVGATEGSGGFYRGFQGYNWGLFQQMYDG